MHARETYKEWITGLQTSEAIFLTERLRKIAQEHERQQISPQQEPMEWDSSLAVEEEHKAASMMIITFPEQRSMEDTHILK